MHALLPILLSGAAMAATINAPLRKRAECGPGIGSCDPGQCCSEAGWCGTTADYCGGSQCQLDYSDSCDTFFPPPGASTESIARPLVGSVPYGSIITTCANPGTLALTYDDGPYIYTSNLLDILEAQNITATFFVAGNNIGKNRMDNPDTPWPAVMQRMYAAGHHIASHTWTHRNLNEVNSTIQRTEIIYNEMAFRNLFGWIPTYMRPPFLECDAGSGCQNLLKTLGYHIINVNIDTKDYMYDSPEEIQTAKDRFSNGVSTNAAANKYIELSHDVHYQTVVNLTQFMIDTAKARGYRLVTVGECLNDPRENWYRSAGGAISSGVAVGTTRTTTTTSVPTSVVSTPVSSPQTRATSSTASTSVATRTSSSSVPASTNVSPDQTCGGTTGYTCLNSAFGNCCSYYGFCGSSLTYCGTGCQSGFGSCSPQSSTVTESSNGLCGSQWNATCKNYGTKTCCSQYGYCGNSATHCGTGCQSLFGTCN
ncbi:polysaccharide deacetylase [Colletotrichum scovillei]|uniref:Polysaccharide deacetylase n=1 Tax=Colletotrichum scovillei TaxID=1209932 RepID=A0A9P7QTJ5_9PEZI|nr:polysaccharide deacetylase [Colletotrichum scovillei]KAF4774730.1 polysaccharide deacetylase [Colletotrichum scovillei]KAG7039074.1 polysaccharide deacetylase [Colletotrichum scovillei]KAG7041197.1 polysaccharide deacetylase [Colletotrichum scovillei]KAG7061229.1 polysaccharide deacetylase [Colletotrichum scovillei]